MVPIITYKSHNKLHNAWCLIYSTVYTCDIARATCQPSNRRRGSWWHLHTPRWQQLRYWHLVSESPVLDRWHSWPPTADTPATENVAWRKKSYVINWPSADQTARMGARTLFIGAAVASHTFPKFKLLTFIWLSQPPVILQSSQVSHIHDDLLRLTLTAHNHLVDISPYCHF